MNDYTQLFVIAAILAAAVAYTALKIRGSLNKKELKKHKKIASFYGRRFNAGGPAGRVPSDNKRRGRLGRIIHESTTGQSPWPKRPPQHGPRKGEIGRKPRGWKEEE